MVQSDRGMTITGASPAFAIAWPSESGNTSDPRSGAATNCVVAFSSIAAADVLAGTVRGRDAAVYASPLDVTDLDAGDFATGSCWQLHNPAKAPPIVAPTAKNDRRLIENREPRATRGIEPDEEPVCVGSNFGSHCSHIGWLSSLVGDYYTSTVATSQRQ